MLSVELVSLPIFGADSFSRVDQVFDHSPQTYEQMRFACDFWGTDEHHSYFTLTHTRKYTHTQLTTERERENQICTLFNHKVQHVIDNSYLEKKKFIYQR